MCKELSGGKQFFVYMSESADSLASCCRLVMSLLIILFIFTRRWRCINWLDKCYNSNMNRLIQDKRDFKTEIEKIQLYQVAHRSLIEDYQKMSMLTVYDAGFISLKTIQIHRY